MNKLKSGQGLVEYALILVLVDIVVYAILLLLGPVIGNTFSNVIAGLPDDSRMRSTGLSGTSVMRGEEQTITELDEVRESIITLWDGAVEQEESINEGLDLILEAAVEGLEVMVDYPDEIDNQYLSESLPQGIQYIKDGNLEAFQAHFADLISNLDEAPLYVQVALARKMAPSLIACCEVLSAGKVSEDTIDEALEAVNGLDDDHPRKEELQELLQEAVDIIEARNDFIELRSDIEWIIIDQFVPVLLEADEDALAEQFTAGSEACSE